jgi:hypothetical protein
VRVFADLDDDDNDGVPDANEANIVGQTATDVSPLTLPRGTKLRSVEGDAARLINAGKPVQVGDVLGGKVGIQGLRAGSSRLQVGNNAVDVRVVEVAALDAASERISLARSHASITRTMAALSSNLKDAQDSDALRWLMYGPSGSVPTSARITSFRPDGAELDQLENMELSQDDCPAGTPTDYECRYSQPIRVTTDVADREHPGAADRSVRGEVGGFIQVLVGDEKVARVRVGGPRKSSLGQIDRYKVKLRVRVLRATAGGPPAIGIDEKSALKIARGEIDIASSLWGQCGIHFGFGSKLDVTVEDPPPTHLVAVGCDFGVPASGGELNLLADNKPIRVRTTAGETPNQVAPRLAAALESAGFTAVLSPNARPAPAAQPSVDVLVRRADGRPAHVKQDGDKPISSDQSLRLCLGEVDLSDGLSHFSDFTAVAGTLEERSLVKAFDDGDPTSVEVFIIPSFERTGRIGESFITEPGAAVQNTVIVDRLGIRAGARSFALAHELGHVLLDMPGHPDDFGVDSPSSLMDADAADPTIFGPRRLSVAECERALIQSGPRAPVPLLEPWPLFGTPQDRTVQRPPPRKSRAN